jgi:single-strand DNA-binding protein
MYQNRITLIGFLGRDAEQRSTNANAPYTLLSIATKTSWKKDGEWQSRTEWHRAIVWGRLGEFARTLTKGSHLQLEGELRSREYEKDGVKCRVWEVRTDSILTLDRAERQAGDETTAEADPTDVPF